jgi:hypothetical protein
MAGGVKLTTHFPYEDEVKKTWNYTPTLHPPYVFME